MLGLATSARIRTLCGQLLSVVAPPCSRSSNSVASMDHDLNQFQQPVGHLVQNWSPPAWPRRDTLLGQYCRLESLNPQRHGDELYTAITSQDDDASWTYMAYGHFAAEQSMKVGCFNTQAKTILSFMRLSIASRSVH